VPDLLRSTFNFLLLIVKGSYAMKIRVKQIARTDSYRGRGVKAAYRPFKPGGGGSSPSGPIGA
jgi:hypothetical protein